MQVDNIILTQFIEKHEIIGDIYLSKKENSDKLLATWRIERNVAENDKLILKLITNEIIYLKRMNHPNIIKLEECKKTRAHIYIVTEYANGGRLSDYLKEFSLKNKKPFSELIVQHIMKEIIEALIYIHDLDIIHGNINLDNIFVDFNSEIDIQNKNLENSRIKISNFTKATLLTENNNEINAYGRPINSDPRILEKLLLLTNQNIYYDDKIDIWSLGTICYELLTGKPIYEPYDEQNFMELYNKIKNATFQIPAYLSLEAISFLKNILVFNHKNRPSAKTLKKHPFLLKKLDGFSSTLQNMSINNSNIDFLNSQYQQSDNDEYLITTIKPGEKIITINFLSLYSQDIVHYSIAGKNTVRFSRILVQFYKDYPSYRSKKLTFLLNANPIQNIDKTLDELGITNNSIISIVEDGQQ